jgi:hypothetical protein
LERNPDGFNASQSIALQDTNERHQPAASSTSITRITPLLHKPSKPWANRSWAGFWAGDPADGSLQHVIRDESTIRDVPCSRGDEPVKAQHFPAAQQLAPMTDWLLFSPRKRLIYRRLPQCKVPGIVRTCASASEYILFIVRPSTMLVS